jgi:hypothetical protein
LVAAEGFFCQTDSKITISPGSQVAVVLWHFW